ncbi:uncharacterized protein [Aquarana catesbeiana]|uniref:uncharacterized protein n=1 Tax=Aquarana catesbeiana TaxID=8400 RepID=UPI003CC9E20E
MSPYCWLLLLPSLYRYALCSTDPCGEMKQVVSQESGDILLRVDKSGVIEISWVFRNTLIAMAKPHESMEVKSRLFKNRLYNGTNGSLNITKLTKDDQGEFVANIRLNNNYECNQIYNLTVYKSKWEIIIIAVSTCLSLLAIIALICYLWKKHNYICARMKRKNKLTSTSEDPQQTEHVYMDIEQSKACIKTEATARKGNPNIDPVYMTSLCRSGKSAYKRGNLVQGDDSVQMYCD